MPPASVATTARPRANDSMITRPRPSGQDGSTSTVAVVELLGDGLRLEPLVVLDAAGEVRHEPRRRRPAASRCRRSRAAPRAAARRRDARRRRALRRSCTPRARRRRPRSAARAAAQAARSVNAERSLNAVKTALGGTPRDVLDQPRREARDGPRRVGPPDRAGREGVRERADQPARGRAVQPRERPPVAVHLDDHRRRAGAASARPSERGRAEKGIGRRRSRRGRKLADLACAPGTAAAGRRGGRRAGAGARRRASRKRSSLGPLSAGRRADDAVVELLLDRVPLLREPRRQREACSARVRRRGRAALGHLAASERSASSLP